MGDLMRISRQGKQLSQIISYIWRWANNDPQKKETQNARQLKKYFEELEKKNLFRADPRDWLINNPARTVEEAPEEVRLLIAVFGKKRIEDENKYLSPLFNSTELGDGEPGDTRYEFILNPDSFRGALEDPSFGSGDAFKFIIGYPPAPKFGEATITESQLESWINNDDNAQNFPSNIFIPVSTS